MSLEELKTRKIWFCWNYEERGDKRTKVPVSAFGGATGTNRKYAHTWTTYSKAADAAARHHNSGVGFRVPEDFFFLDIDHVDLADPYVQTMLSRFDSYAERSVSGGGVHIYGHVDISRIPTTEGQEGQRRLDPAYYLKNPHNGTELYFGALTNRFAVFTGDMILDRPLRDCTDALLETLDRDMRKAAEKTKPKTGTGQRSGKAADTKTGSAAGRASRSAKPQLPKDTDVKRIVKGLLSQSNGDKFRRMYSGGDTSDYNNDDSAADCALCSLIAFRTGPDPDMIDRVFRSSALYREKWERADYRENTISKGIEACRGVFHRSRMEHPDFIQFTEDTLRPYIVPALLAKHIREHLNYVFVRDSGKHGLLIYVYENGVYRLYAPEMLKGIIKQYISDYDETLVRMVIVNEVYQQLVTDPASLRLTDLNADEGLINFKNGLLQVTERGTRMLPHDPEVYSTIQIPCDWTDKPGQTPVFDAYMKTLTNGDTAVEQLLLEFIGACISNVKGWRMKKALFLVGDGDTGKSQLRNLVGMLLGPENTVGIDLTEIESRFGTGMIFGMRMAGSSDMGFMTVDELRTFKMLTGGDSVFAEFKGQQGFSYIYDGLLWFCMNQLPNFGGDDGKWVYDRIIVVRCPNVIPKDQQDRMLLDKLYAERDGIVWKAVRALQNVIRNGYSFTEPESVFKLRNQYRAQNSTVIGFFEECMCPWPGGRIPAYSPCTTGMIYRVYRAWCRENNNGYAKTAKDFRDSLADYLGADFDGISTRQKGNTYYRDYCLTNEAKQEFSQVYGYDIIAAQDSRKTGNYY